MKLLACFGGNLEPHLIGEKPRRFLRAPAGAAEDEPLPAVETGELPSQSLVEILDEPVLKLEHDATSRKVELSVRAALGASRRILVQQLFTENLFLAVLAGIGGSILALWLQPVILALFPLDLLGISEVRLSAPMLSFALVVSLATAVLFGGGPALTASRANPAADLKGGRRTSAGGKGGWARSGLVVAQVVLSVVLLTASGLLVRSFVRLQSVDLRFQTENLVTARLSIVPTKYEDAASRAQFYRGVLEDVEAVPGVVSASFIDKVPIRHRFTNWHVWDPEDPPEASERSRSAFARFVMPGYFDAMGIPILSGRDHEEWGEENRLPPLVVNQVMAKALFPDRDPIGRRVSVNMEKVKFFEIVGVVGDIRITSLNSEPFLQMYFNYATYPSISMNLVFRAQGDPVRLVPAIRQAVLDRDPDALLTDAAAMTDIISDSISGNRVFGATALHVMRTVLGRGLLLVAGGLAVGFAGVFGVTRLLQSQLFQVGTTDPMTFGGVAITFLVIGTLASLVPAWRATRVDPVQAIHAG